MAAASLGLGVPVVKLRFYYCALLACIPQLLLQHSAVADISGTHARLSFCPCVDRSSTRFALLTHFHPLASTTGAQLHASVRQAARDRGYQLSVYNYNAGDGFNLRGAAAFLDAEIGAGTAGIVASLDDDRLLASLSAANAAGIPIYLVGGGGPDLIHRMQDREPFVGGPHRASVRYIGPDESTLASSLAATLIAQGVNHVECVVLDLEDARWPSRCRMVQKAFVDAGMSGGLLPVLGNVEAAVRGMLERMTALRAVAILVEDAATYGSVKAALPRPNAIAVTVVVYETSVTVLGDVHAGRPVLAVDLGTYAQGYLALALASVEHLTRQMLASDVGIEFTILGRGAKPVTDAIMRREVCRAAGNPVCGDPGVLPVTSSGCACFDRAEVRYKVVGSVAKQLLTSYYLYQGMVDAQRDLPGSTFRWNVQDTIDLIAQLTEYAAVANGSFYRGVISLDAYTADTSDALLGAMRSVSESGKPLYLGYLQAPAANFQAFLDRFKARFFVGPSQLGAARYIGGLARDLQGRHVLIQNNFAHLSVMWEWMRTVVASFLGGDYVFPPAIWDFPPFNHGSPTNRTGAWALFTDPLTNHTAQVMENKNVFLGDAFLKPLRDRLVEEFPGPVPTDILVLVAATNLFTTAALPVLANLTREQPGRPPVRVITHKCSDVEYSALLRWNLTANEEFVLGCVDEQMYLSTYLPATAAALEQQTGERVVGEVRTERLLRYDQLPLHYARRVACERSNNDNGFSKGQLGVFYPLCDARHGCVEGGLSAPANAVACSGHGTCRFPTRVVMETSDGSQGACVCHRGWRGTFCSERSGAAGANGNGGHWARILLGVLLSVGLVALCWLILARMAHRGSVAPEEIALLLEGSLQERLSRALDAELLTSVVVMDVDGLGVLLAWDATTTKKALEVLQEVVCSLLTLFHGSKVSTKQGASTLIFQDPVNALKFVMALQLGLLYPQLVEARTQGRLAMLRQRWASTGRGPPDWPPSLLKQDCAAEVKCPSNQARLYRGLRVRVGMHLGAVDTLDVSVSCQLAKGEVVDLASAICNIASGGQVLLSMAAWRSLGSHVSGTVCHHMGMHEVTEGLPPIHLMQVLPESMVKRAPFPPTKSLRQLVPSFFDAPAAEYYVNGQIPAEPVIICFMYVASAKKLRKTPGYWEALHVLVAFVQKRLAEFDAYEVEEKDGNFLLAFRSSAKAVQFAETVQREAMGLPWCKKLLEEEPAAELIKLATPDGQGGMTKETVVFRGLRLQIGMCMGVPSDCQPHMATGRAAYFGPVVNRAARIAATAAPGQTLVNHECYASAKGECGSVLFKELGRFKLKGVKEPMHLYQVSSHELSVRLFPRTLRLATHIHTGVLTAPRGFVAPGEDNREDSVAGGNEISSDMVVPITLSGRTVRKNAPASILPGQAGRTLAAAWAGKARGFRDWPSVMGRVGLVSSDDDAGSVHLEGGLDSSGNGGGLDLSGNGGGLDLSGNRGGLDESSNRGPWPHRHFSYDSRLRAARRSADSAEDYAINDFSFDKLVELAVEQHRRIKALKRRLGLAAEC